MMKQTVCLLFVLALIAQICAIPVEKAYEEKAKVAAEKASAEGKGKAGAAEEEANHVASEAKDKTENAAADAKEHAETLSKGAQNQHHAKDCHKPGHHGIPGLGEHPASKAVKQFEELGKSIADQGVKVATGLLGIMGL